MTEVICPSELASLRKLGVAVGRRRQSKTPSRQCFWYGFERDNGYTIRETDHGTDGTSEGVSGNPDVRVWIKLSHIGIELSSGLVIPILIAQGLLDTGVITGVCSCSAIADLPIRPLALLGTATAKEQIIIDLVVCCRPITIKDGGRGAF